MWVEQGPFKGDRLQLLFSKEEAVMDQSIPTTPSREPWNKGKLVGQKAPLKLKDIWAIRVRLQISDRARDLGYLI